MEFVFVVERIIHQIVVTQRNSTYRILNWKVDRLLLEIIESNVGVLA